MATVNKDFKIKSGLVVEGTTATVNGYDILTKKTDDQNYIIGLIGGSATAEATPDTVVLRDENADFSAHYITADLFIGDVDGQAGSVSSLSNHNTDDLAEGTGNVYFTDTRAKDAVSSALGQGIEYIDGTFDVQVAGGIEINGSNQVAIDRVAVDSWYDASGSATSAENNAKSYADGLASNYDPAGAADTAYNDAVAAASSDATTKANNAESNANAYTDGEITTALSTAQGYADQAEANANAYTDNAVSGLAWKQAVNLKSDSNINVASSVVGLVIDGHAALTTADTGYGILLTGQTDPTQNGIWETFAGDGTLYVHRRADSDTYQELVGSAVYVMEGTQYGSTSWVQSNHYLSDFNNQNWTQFSGQGSVTAGSGITVDGLEVSINRTTVDGWYDSYGAAAGAEEAANLYADGLASNYDPAGSAQGAYDNAVSASNTYTDQQIGTLDTGYTVRQQINLAESNANSYTDTAIGNLDLVFNTDEISEGTTNLYFTDSRAKDSAADLLTNANLTNITITGTGSGLTITAENGVADSTTDDLTEGSNNLYFTGGRVLDAVEGADILPGTVSINTFRKEEATQQSVSSASTVNVHSFAYPYESVKYLVRVVGWEGGVKHSQITEILMTIDGNNNIAMTEYGNVHTSTNPLATFSAAISNTLPTLTATTAVSGCEIIAAATMLSWAD